MLLHNAARAGQVGVHAGATGRPVRLLTRLAPLPALLCRERHVPIVHHAQ
jgi:hypothetical protein